VSAPIDFTFPAPSYTYAPVSNPEGNVEICDGRGSPDASAPIVVTIALPSV
jgi:hypothetical protein